MLNIIIRSDDFLQPKEQIGQLWSRLWRYVWLEEHQRALVSVYTLYTEDHCCCHRWPTDLEKVTECVFEACLVHVMCKWHPHTLLWQHSGAYVSVCMCVCVHMQAYIFQKSAPQRFGGNRSSMHFFAMNKTLLGLMFPPHSTSQRC